jgi:hypothetical protein
VQAVLLPTIQTHPATMFEITEGVHCMTKDKNNSLLNSYNLYVAAFVIILFIVLPLYYNQSGMVRQSNPRDEELKIKLRSEFEKYNQCLE